MSEERGFRRVFRGCVLAACALGVLLLTAAGIVWMRGLAKDPDMLGAFQDKIEALGFIGWGVLFIIQFVQIVAAFIPGGPVQIVAGALYGPLGGVLVCLLGTVAATFCVFAITKRFGKNALILFVNDRDVSKFKFLSDERKLERLVLILFFIPGTPKDALSYLFALTPIDRGRFILIATCARLPALVTSVIAGDSIAGGMWLRAGILFVFISAASFAGYLIYSKLIMPGKR